MNSGSWIDISLPIHNGMIVWPTDPPVGISPVSRISDGDASNASRVSMGAHTGTHIDAPFHFIKNGVGIDKMPYDATIGRARVILIKDTESIKPEELKEKNIKFFLKKGYG